MRLRCWRTILIAAVAAAALAPAARAADPEGCLTCHRYRGLARADAQTRSVRLFYVDPDYYDRGLGPHARVRCTDCHTRGEVDVVPHRKVSPVDCSKTCHLSSPDRVDVTFSHGRIRGMLEGSVHGGKVLGHANELLAPLREGQAGCLLCHDEPRFRRGQQSWAQAEAPIGRCEVCHDEQLPVNDRYYYWHVHARSQPARDQQDTIRVCAVCHSNAKVRAAFKLPDAVGSYLASFHGKAVLLGSRETAECLSCHVGALQNVHLMKKHDRPDAATNAAVLGDTCRTPACHATAGQRISTAAVHLDLATDRGIEFFIACLFILMILFTFGPSAMMTALKMLQIALGRHDPRHHHHVEVARKLQADPRGRKLLERFNAHQRVQHWMLVTAFTTLVCTGFPIKFADRPWAAWVIDKIGGLIWARQLHRFAGALLILGMAYHLGYIAFTSWRKKRRTGESWFRIAFNLPMMVRPADMKEMNHLMLHLGFLRPSRPETGRFTLEEKFEYVGVFWGSILLGITGVLMWANAWTSRYIPGRVLTIAALFHTFEAFLALLHVGIVHMISVIFAPGAFPVSKAMFTGETPAEEMAEAHAGMLAEAQNALLPEGPTEEATPAEEVGRV